jgi:hypothetical protein
MQNACDSDFRRCVTHHGREQDTPNGVTQCVTIATFERLKRYLGTVVAKLFDINRLGFQQIGLHATSSQYPQLVTPVRLVKRLNRDASRFRDGFSKYVSGD